MELHLENKKALVTGSTVGIGFAIAKLLANEGATIYINGRSEERVEAAVEAISKSHPKAIIKGIAADLSTAKGINQIIDKVPEIDLLINNVGVYEMKPFEKITDGDWLKFFELNVMSGVRLCRHYLSLMKKRNWGRIIFISSESGVNIPADMIHYGVSKASQLALARGLAELTAGTGVTVNSVLPGPTLSEGVEGFIDQASAARGVDRQTVEREFFTSYRPSSLLKRFATPEEVAAMVAFVCSPLAAAVNGAALRVEGGIVRSIV